MKVCFLVEDRGKEIRIPLTKNEVCFIGDLPSMFFDSKIIKYSRHSKEALTLSKKFTFLSFDIVSRGLWYEFKNGKIDKKKPVTNYLVEKPVWSKKQ